MHGMRRERSETCRARMDGSMTQSGGVRIDRYAQRIGAESERMVRKQMSEAMDKQGRTEGKQGTPEDSEDIEPEATRATLWGASELRYGHRPRREWDIRNFERQCRHRLRRKWAAISNGHGLGAAPAMGWTSFTPPHSRKTRT